MPSSLPPHVARCRDASELLVIAYRLSRRRLHREPPARPAWDVSDVLDILALA